MIPIQNVTIVGLGGIGSHLVENVVRALYYTKGAPENVLLIDGDKYTEKNLTRQKVLASDVGENKAVVWARALGVEYGDRLKIHARAEFVGPKNIFELPLENGLILLCLDNHKSRKLFSCRVSGCSGCPVHEGITYRWVENGILISGGNDLSDGMVLMTMRAKGRDLLPPIDTFHLDIRNPKDKNPAELTCAELAKMKGGEQIMAANMMAANIMFNMFHLAIMRKDKDLLAQAEVYFDVIRNACRPATVRVPKEKLAEPKKEVRKPRKGKVKTATTPVAQPVPGDVLDVMLEDDLQAAFEDVKGELESQQ